MFSAGIKFAPTPCRGQVWQALNPQQLQRRYFMNQASYDDLGRLLMRQSREIQALNPDYQTTEWYLLKYLRRSEHSPEPAAGRHRMESSMRGSRFYIDRVETGSSLEQRCLRIRALYRHARRGNGGGRTT